MFSCADKEKIHRCRYSKLIYFTSFIQRLCYNEGQNQCLLNTGTEWRCKYVCAGKTSTLEAVSRMPCQRNIVNLLSCFCPIGGYFTVLYSTTPYIQYIATRTIQTVISVKKVWGLVVVAPWTKVSRFIKINTIVTNQLHPYAGYRQMQAASSRRLPGVSYESSYVQTGAI